MKVELSSCYFPIHLEKLTFERSMKKLLFIIALFFGISGGLFAQAPQSPNAPQICPVYVPNAFTPNGDNINDRFVLQVGEDCEVLKFNLQIFDRWGRLVFETNSIDENEAWDGQLENNRLDGGVYLYKLNVDMINYNNRNGRSVKVDKQGSVILIR